MQQPTLRELQEDELSVMDADPLLDPLDLESGTFEQSRTNSTLSLASVVGERTDFKLQAVDPFFTDSTGLYAADFETMLTNLDGNSSEGQLCIEDYLKKSEKQWYNRFHDAKLGKTSSPASSVFRMPWGNGSSSSLGGSRPGSPTSETPPAEYEGNEQFGLKDDHVTPTGIRRLMLQKIGDWPVYAFLLAFVSVNWKDMIALSFADPFSGTNYCGEFLSNYPSYWAEW